MSSPKVRLLISISLLFLFAASLFQLIEKSTLFNSKVAIAVETPPEPTGFISSIDTMKESLDTLNNKLSPSEIANTINLASTMNTTHIAISVPYDNPDYAKLWIDAIRAKGKKVWFRMSWNNWLGTYNQPGTMTPTEFLDKTKSYILANPTFFKSGDIFDITPEPEQGKYWANTYGASWNWSPAPPNDATREYNAFIRNGTTTANDAFTQINLKGVITNIRSFNPYQILNVLEPETVTTLNKLTIDGYPDVGITDPAQASQARINEINQIYNKWHMPIILGEMGYDRDNPFITDTLQQTVLKAEFDSMVNLPFLQGVNYWVGPGYPSPDNYNGTRVFAGTRGNWTLRPGGVEVKNYFAKNIYRPFIANTKTLPPAIQNGDRIDLVTQAATGVSLSGATVKFSILNPQGTTIYTDTQTPVGFTGGVARNLSGSWPVPKGQTAGTYTLKIEITVPGQPASTDTTTFTVN